MVLRVLFWLLCGFLILAGVGLGYRYWTTGRGTAVTIEWTTASELETAGFNLYRSESPNGPFIQVNDHLIPASPDPLTGGSYTFEDNGVTAGQTYYYQLEDVELGGKTITHGPIEVRAQRMGLVNLILAVFAMAVGTLGVMILLFKER